MVVDVGRERYPGTLNAMLMFQKTNAALHM
jgi:hypothetical protein